MTKPYDFQSEDLVRVHDEFGGRALCAWQMGLGKTFFALKYYRDYVTGPMVVVCPAVAKGVWAAEALKHYGLRAHVLNGRRPSGMTPPRDARVWVVNYDILGVPRPGKPTWSEWLAGTRPDLVVLDEAVAIKDHTTQRARACRHLCRGVPNVLALDGTGTLESRPIEMWSVLNLLDRRAFPSRFDYGLKFCNGHKGPFSWDFSGASNLGELRELLLSSVMVRRRKEDVLDQLPPVTHSVVPLTLPAAAYAEYARAETDYIGWLLEKAPEMVPGARRATAITRLRHLKQLAAELKRGQADEWVRDFLATGNKLLAFGHHRDFLTALYDWHRDHSVLITGDTDYQTRTLLTGRFNDDPRCRLCLGNIEAAGKAWSCTSASDVAFLEMAWTPGRHLQAVDRCRGIGRGTGRPVGVYWLVADGTVETHLCRVIQQKALTVGQILDGGDEDYGLDVYDLLNEALVAGAAA